MSEQNRIQKQISSLLTERAVAKASFLNLVRIQKVVKKATKHNLKHENNLMKELKSLGFVKRKKERLHLNDYQSVSDRLSSVLEDFCDYRAQLKKRLTETYKQKEALQKEKFLIVV